MLAVSNMLDIANTHRACSISAWRAGLMRWRTRRLNKVKKKSKVVYSSLYETPLRATMRHLPYGITQRYLSPNTGERAPP